ncbi:MAG: hypothetical protein MZW92_04680 [Comamonadaceae bacterium]|nr:hypothetical protein [Comamonadaceae bacterium]
MLDPRARGDVDAAPQPPSNVRRCAPSASPPDPRADGADRRPTSACAAPLARRVGRPHRRGAAARMPTPHGESPARPASIADAQLAATRGAGAQLALHEPGRHPRRPAPAPPTACVTLRRPVRRAALRQHAW